MPVKILTQQDHRESGVFEDQFGRPYLVIWEKSTTDPVQIMRAHFQHRDAKGKLLREEPWTDPLGVSEKYISIPKGRFGMKQLGHLYVDFARFAADQREALKEWVRQLWRHAEEQYPSQKPDVRAMEVDPLLLRLAGPKPWPRAETVEVIVKAPESEVAKQLLGLPGHPLGDEAKALLGAPLGADALLAYMDERDAEEPDNYRDFVQWAFQHGKAKNTSEVAALWREHKSRKAPVGAGR